MQRRSERQQGTVAVARRFQVRCRSSEVEAEIRVVGPAVELAFDSKFELAIGTEAAAPAAAGLRSAVLTSSVVFIFMHVRIRQNLAWVGSIHRPAATDKAFNRVDFEGYGRRDFRYSLDC